MNTGAISSRYAKALLKYVQQTGRGEQVCAQVHELLRNPDLKGAELEPELQRFVALLSRNGRLEDVRLILRSFERMYCESVGILQMQLVTVVPSPETEARLKALLDEQTGLKVWLESSLDPDLIGGFTLQVGDYMLDASVRRQIDDIRRQFVIQNNRIV